jgi:drug/metabolite transporter (DMT)-like permease
LDYLVFGHALQPRDIIGMILILAGLALTLRSKEKAPSAQRAMMSEPR